MLGKTIWKFHLNLNGLPLNLNEAHLCWGVGWERELLPGDRDRPIQ